MTLVELMVAMVISSIVIFFLFSIQTRMSRAYQGQGTVSEINQNLQAAKQQMLTELRMAGFGLSGGFVDSGPDVDVSASAVALGGGGFRASLSGFTVSNNAYGDGNDSFRLLYSDPSNKIVITAFGPVFADTLDPAPPFTAGEPVIIAGRTAACLIAVTGTNPNKIHFNATAGVGVPYNQVPQNKHCDRVRDALSNNEPVSIVKFLSRSYRIDPNRATEGYLQMSPSGESVADDWIDMGVGFTNMQIATRYFESGDAVDLDGDGDPERDWYSGDNQAVGDLSRPPDAVLIQASISIEARSPHGTRGSAASTTTPAFIDMANVNNNSRGDWGQDCTGAPTDPCGIHLSATPDASRPDRYKGEYIYRSTTSIVDLRNMGIGR